MKKATLMLAVLAMCSVASAALIVQQDRVVINYGGTDYQQVTVRVVGEGTIVDGVISPGADFFRGFDGRFDGPMNQVWAFYGFNQTPTLPTVGDPAINPGWLSVAQNAADSHMLFQPTVSTNAAAEDGPGLGSWLAASSTVNMAFALEPVQYKIDFPLVQLVIPMGQTVRMFGAIADASTAQIGIDMPIGVPEPATMGLLAFGAVALVIRRRNRR